MGSSSNIPFALPGFKIDQVDERSDTLVIHAHSIASAAKCPCCGQSSTRVHCHYTRSPRDLPCNGRRVRLVLGVRRFRCSNEQCERQTFAERVPHVVPVHGQRTMRLTTVLRAITFEASAEAGSRITRHLNMPMSADTLLRILRRTILEPAPTPRVLGVDDWAFKKGNRYGTILVDLEKRYPVDLLADRTADTLTPWLQAHPGIEVVSRDRSHEYIAAIRAGAPQAVQVADRWHLLRNLSGALQHLLEKHAKVLRLAAQHVQGPGDTPTDQQEAEMSTLAERPPSRRELRLGEVKRLVAEGYSQRTIARRLRISRNTIRRYLETDELPRYQLRGPRRSTITAYVPHLEAHWTEGCHNSRILLGRTPSARVSRQLQQCATLCAALSLKTTAHFVTAFPWDAPLVTASGCVVVGSRTRRAIRRAENVPYGSWPNVCRHCHRLRVGSAVRAHGSTPPG
jgi:transposase